ncbi:MAG: glycosyltransferase family 4 protein, partial [Chloroflexota bacterium]|nr:glycosyltransferase family 4 protein [Chloroflexota bacterium]
HTGERNWRTELVRRATFGRVKRFILHSRALSASFRQQYLVPPERLGAVHLGKYDVLCSWASGAVEQEPRTVLFFGRLSPYKGLDVLLEAAPEVARQVPGMRFVIAGPVVAGYTLPPPPPLAGGGRVEVIDRYVSNAELADLFQRATVVACPYVDASQSGVILTAYAFGRPVVATSVGGLPEYVEAGQTGLLVPPADAGALAGALVSIVSTPAWQERARSAIARLDRDRLNWQRAGAGLLDEYAAAIGDH